MNCQRPRAPAGDRASGFNPLSTTDRYFNSRGSPSRDNTSSNNGKYIAERPSMVPKWWVRRLPYVTIRRCATGFHRRSSSDKTFNAARPEATDAESKLAPMGVIPTSGRFHNDVSELTQ